MSTTIKGVYLDLVNYLFPFMFSYSLFKIVFHEIKKKHYTFAK